MSIFDISAVLLGLSAFFGYLNYNFLRLPHTIGLVFIGLIASLAIIAVDTLSPSSSIAEKLAEGMVQVDFYDTLMKGMLCFMLFSGAAQVNFTAFRGKAVPIGILAFFGTLISTFVVGAALWSLFSLFGVEAPFIWCLVFGALISPTDPVAVLSLFKTVHVPAEVEAKMAGESLFNDGIGVVVFTAVLTLAVNSGSGGEAISAGEVGVLFLQEAVGGALLGLLAGWVCYHGLRTLDDASLEVLLTLAVVVCTYAAALRLEASGPIAVVVAGLFVGARGGVDVSEESRDYLRKFWTLIDEILNSVLFLLIGLEVLLVYQRLDHLAYAMLAIPVCLFARWLSVFIPLTALSRWISITPGAIAILTWGGLRGGIAVALALSLPENEYKSVILTVTYAVVLFSILVQGLTMQPLVKRLFTVAA